GEALFPGRALFGAFGAQRAPGLQDVVGDLEGRRAPSELLTRALDLLYAERLAVGGRLSGLGRRAVADHRLAGDEPGLRAIGARLLEGGRDGLRVVAVDADRVPARGLEAGDLVVGDGEARRPVDRDRIVVPEHDEAAELQVAGERDRLVAD